jgi:hypothetical protein
VRQVLEKLHHTAAIAQAHCPATIRYGFGFSFVSFFICSYPGWTIAGRFPRMISSAQRTASEIAATVAGTRFPPSYCANFRAARILAAINSTRLRPLSTGQVYQFRVLFATLN